MSRASSMMSSKKNHSKEAWEQLRKESWEEEAEEVEAAVDHQEDLTQAALHTAPRDQATPEAILPLHPAILLAVVIQQVTVGAHQAEARRADPPAAHPEVVPEAVALPPEDQDLDQLVYLEREHTEELRKWQFTPMHTIEMEGPTSPYMFITEHQITITQQDTTRPSTSRSTMTGMGIIFITRRMATTSTLRMTTKVVAAEDGSYFWFYSAFAVASEHSSSSDDFIIKESFSWLEIQK